MPIQPGYFGLSGIELADDVIDFGYGVELTRTYAHLMAPYVMAFNRPEPGRPHPGPWKAALGGSGVDVTAQLAVPSLKRNGPPSLATARVIVFLIRLWNTPEVVISVLSTHDFTELPSLQDNEAKVIPYDVRPRHFRLRSPDGPITRSSAQWVKDHWQATQVLAEKSNEFRYAMDALDAGQFLANTALTMVSLWGALEAIFAPSAGELSFRVSSLLASYLEPPGEERLALQKETARLYGRRSKAAHGKPDHDDADLLATFLLIRRVLIKAIEAGALPNREQLEEMLLGTPGGADRDVSL